MPITAADTGAVDELRGRVLDYLARRRADGQFRVIDVGGRYNPWADEHTDAYVDLFPTDSEDKKTFVGNICTEEVWRAIHAEGLFDFSICTHVLEDVRDPFFVAKQLARISKAGFVSVPTKHSELSNVESRFYLGYCHHRWIFTVQGENDARKMVGVGKMPIVGYFNNRFRPVLKLIHLFGRWIIGAKIERRLGIFPGGGRPTWIDKSLVGHDKELAVWWDEELPLEPLADDYSGETCLQLADLYRDSIRDGL
ncbi:MAG: hypothetical protein ACE5GX_08470 [Thermoanaerobaculia bacterium]